MDAETAKRIARRLVDGLWMEGPFDEGREGVLATFLQEAAVPWPKPGLYLVRHQGGIHLELFALVADRGGRPQPHWRDLLLGYDVERPAPKGDIVSGPHTCEELLEAVQRHEPRTRHPRERCYA